MEDVDFCSRVVTIPQFGYTCWFNAILMASLYSSGSRDIVLKKFKSIPNPDNKFLQIIKKMVEQHYTHNEKTQKFLHSFKPETILLTMLKFYPDIDLTQRLQKNLKYNSENNIHLQKSFVYYTKSISNFYKNLGINYLDILYNSENDEYLIDTFDKFNNIENSKKNRQLIRTTRDKEEKRLSQIINSKPDILVFSSSELYLYHVNNIQYVLDKYEKINPSASNAFYLSNYDIKTNINSCNDTIHFNEEEYTLDSCLLFSYNEIDVYHIIAGLHCRDTKYIYNGFNTKKTIVPSACSLMKYNWDIKTPDNDFCIDENKCLIDKIEEEYSNDYCFSFNKGYRILIYTKKQILTPKIEKSLSLSLSSSSINLTNLLDIKQLTIKQLKEQIRIYNFNIFDLLDLYNDENITRLQFILFNIIKLYYKQYIYGYKEKFYSNIDKNILSNILQIINNLNNTDSDLMNIKKQITDIDLLIIKYYYTDVDITQERLDKIYSELVANITDVLPKLIIIIREKYIIHIDDDYINIYIKIKELNEIIKNYKIEIETYKENIKKYIDELGDRFLSSDKKEKYKLKFQKLYDEQVKFDIYTLDDFKGLLNKLEKLNAKLVKKRKITSTSKV